MINGDRAALEAALRSDPALVGARSSPLCFFDPPVMHRATLLHYVAANGVEQYRQKTPPNAVEIARVLLRAGAEPDAFADMYGVECTTMSMLVSSDHPARAGLHGRLVTVGRRSWQSICARTPPRGDLPLRLTTPRTEIRAPLQPGGIG